jgi:hypothetical protein
MLIEIRREFLGAIRAIPTRSRPTQFCDPGQLRSRATAPARAAVQYHPNYVDALLAYAARARASSEEIETPRTRDGIRTFRSRSRRPRSPNSGRGFPALLSS